MRHFRISLQRNGEMYISVRGVPMMSLRFAPGEADELVSVIGRLKVLLADRVAATPEYEREYAHHLLADSDEKEMV